MILDDPREIGRRAVNELARRAGESLSAADHKLLEKRAETPEEIDQSDVPRLEELGETMTRGFFDAATEGHEFIDRELITARFGRSAASNYPDAGPDFLRFANTYWTLKLLADELRGDDPYLGLTALISGLERQVGPIFFPTPGPIKVNPNRRESDQRAILEEYAPRLNVDAFMAGNPILARDRQGGRSGCAIALLLPLVGAARLLLA